MKKWLFIFLFLYQAIAIAEQAGTLLFATKQVYVERAGQEKSVSRGASLFVGDRLITREGAQAQFKYSNGTLISLQPNSSYKILSYTPQDKNIQSKASLDRGGLESTTQGQKKASLQTPVVALAINGTKYRIGIFCSNRAKVTRLPTGKKVTTKGCEQAGIEVTEGQVIVNGSYALGPGEPHNAALYNGITQQITYGPIDWPGHGWVTPAAPTPAGPSAGGTSSSTTTSQASNPEISVVIPTTVTTTVTTTTNSQVVETTSTANTPVPFIPPS